MSEESIQNNKLLLLGKLTAGFVHEIRNPLSVIKLNLDYLKMLDNELPQEAAESVNSSLEAFRRVNFLIEDVLDFTRKNNNKQNKISINEISERAISIIDVTAKKKGIHLVKELEDGLPSLYLNENKLLQVMLNLINNAVEASYTNKDVIIRTRLKNEDGIEKVVWEVEDFGCGMSEEEKLKIMNGFFTSKVNGHGLGLSVCRMLLEEMNSEMRFESTLNKGTKFTLSFSVKS